MLPWKLREGDLSSRMAAVRGSVAVISAVSLANFGRMRGVDCGSCVRRHFDEVLAGVHPTVALVVQ